LRQKLQNSILVCGQSKMGTNWVWVAFTTAPVLASFE
jgi:hypothetical protein